MIIYLAVAFERYWAEAARTYVARGSTLEQVQPDSVSALYERRVKDIDPRQKCIPVLPGDDGRDGKGQP